MDKQAKIILFSCLYILGIISVFSNISSLFVMGIFAILTICLIKNLLSFKYFLVLLCVFLFGMINSSFKMKYYDDLSCFQNKFVTVNAEVITIPSNNLKDKISFYAKVNNVNYDDGYVRNIKAKTLVTINDKSGKAVNIKIGDNLKLSGILKQPKEAKNPFQFDYSKYLRHKNTFTLLYVEDLWSINNHSHKLKGKLLRKLNDKRTQIINIHAKNIKSPMLEILGGIIFGDDAVNPDEETKNSFMHSGIFHILAASGMNVTLIFGIWFFFAKNLKINYKLSLITGILLILFYTCMTGFGPPVIRASIMLTLILIGKFLDRTASTMSILFIVAFIMLAYNPFMLFDIGFQLSFAVTFALILTAPLLNFKFKYKLLNYLSGGVLIPVIAQIFAAPFQMYYFNTFSLYSILANIAIIPVLSIVSFLGFISSIIALIPVLSDKICKFADIILNPFLIYIVKIANIFSNLPYAVISVKKPSLFQIILYFILIISLIFIIRFKYYKKYIILTLSSLLIIFILTLIPFSNNKTEILMFSVGNADSILLKSPKEQYFLIDTARLSSLGTNSQAKNIILKYFTNKGIKKLNSLILTHFDSDHAGGTIDILKGINTENIYLSDSAEDTNLSLNIFNYLDENKIIPEFVNERKDIYKEKDFVISVYKPSGINIKDENEKSIITKLKYKDYNFIFMGDGDNKSYEALPDDFKTNITVMKLGHHGAVNTIDKVMTDNTKIFLISTGPNAYNHPYPDTIKLLEANQKEYYRTDYHNAVKISLSKNNMDIYLYSPKTQSFQKVIRR